MLFRKRTEHPTVLSARRTHRASRRCGKSSGPQPGNPPATQAGLSRLRPTRRIPFISATETTSPAPQERCRDAARPGSKRARPRGWSGSPADARGPERGRPRVRCPLARLLPVLALVVLGVPPPNPPSPLRLQAAGGDMALVPLLWRAPRLRCSRAGLRTGHSAVRLFREPASALLDAGAMLLICPFISTPWLSRPSSCRLRVSLVSCPPSSKSEVRSSTGERPPVFTKPPGFRGQSHPERASRNHPE